MDRSRRGRPVVALRQSLAERDQTPPDGVTEGAQESVPERAPHSRSVGNELGAAVVRMNL